VSEGCVVENEEKETRRKTWELVAHTTFDGRNMGQVW
jgi:hypothetical protein